MVRKRRHCGFFALVFFFFFFEFDYLLSGTMILTDD